MVDYIIRSISYLPDDEGMRSFALDVLLNQIRPAAFCDRPGRLAAVRAYGGSSDNSQILRIERKTEESDGYIHTRSQMARPEMVPVERRGHVKKPGTEDTHRYLQLYRHAEV